MDHYNYNDFGSSNSNGYYAHQGRNVHQDFKYGQNFYKQPQSQQLQYSVGSVQKRTQISNSDHRYWKNFNQQHTNSNPPQNAKRSKRRNKKQRLRIRQEKQQQAKKQRQQANRQQQQHARSHSSVIVISSDNESVHVIEDDIKSQSFNPETEHSSSVVVVSDENETQDRDTPKDKLIKRDFSTRYFNSNAPKDNASSSSSSATSSSSLPPPTQSTSKNTSPNFIKTIEVNSNKRKSQGDANNNYEDTVTPKRARYFSENESKEFCANDKFSKQIATFFKENQQQPEFLEKKRNMVAALEKAICQITSQKARLYIVGSSVNGFGRLTSDSDLCLVLDETTDKIGRRIVLNYLKEIQRLLWKTPFAKNISLIPARVAILKFYDNYGKIDCDLNVNNVVGLRNTYLLLAYSMQDPRVQPLGLCIKEWAHQSGINDASEGTLSSYTIILMVISYLQCGTTPPVLPSLQLLYPQNFSSQKPLSRCEQAARSVPTYKSKNLSSHRDLLVGFFRYFATEFDFKNQVMSIRLGKNIQLSPFSNRRDMTEKPIKVEEPFDLSNVARAVGFKSNLIFSKFRNAYNALLATHCDLRSILKLKTNNSTDECFTID